MGVTKLNKIEVLLFLKKYEIINDKTYLKHLTDGKETEDTIKKFFSCKEIEKLKGIKELLTKERKSNTAKSVFKTVKYMILSLAYILFLFKVFSFDRSLLTTFINLIVSGCFGYLTIKIFEVDYREQLKRINSELNIIKFIENKVCANK